MTNPYHLLIRASAGSGKTYQLTNRFIGLIVAGVDPGKILAVTFTRKAAGEILRKVLDRLLEALDDDRKLDQLARSLESCGFPAADRNAVEGALRRLIDQFHRLRVSTLDAFFGQIAGAFALECKLPLGWAILEEERLAAVRASAIGALLEGKSAGDASTLMHRLSKGDSQRRVAEEIDSIVRELHGVWVGTPQPAWKVPPIAPAVAAEEVAKAIEAIEAMEIPLTKKGTERKGWAGEQPRMIEAATLEKWQELFTQGIPRKFLDGLPVTYGGAELEEEAVIEALTVFRSKARSVLSRIIASQNEATRDLLDRYDDERRTALVRAGGVGFSDVTRAIAEEKALENLEEVYFRLDGQIDHLLLDEFQDTSLLQWWIIERIVEELVADPSGDRLVFCVGDGKQAIHGWRGGCREVLETIEETLPAGCVETLEKSWRSSPVILDAVNGVFGALADHDLVADESDAIVRWMSDFKPHEAAYRERKGHVLVRIAEPREGKKPTDAPLLETVDEVEKIHARHPGATIGVLLRKGKDRVAPIVGALRERGIDASEEGGNPLVDSPAVGRVAALLELIEHPGDGPSRLAVAASPLPGILDGLGHGDEDGWQEPAGGAVGAACLRRKILADGLSETVVPIVEGLWQRCGERDRRRLGQLIDLLRSFPHRGIRLTDVITRIHQRQVPAPTSASVQVMTIHKAKGLEFDAVILPDLHSPWFNPSAKLFTSRENPRQVPNKLGRSADEVAVGILGEPYVEMRQQTREATVVESFSLLYVAMTRARHQLLVLLPHWPMGKNGPTRSWQKGSSAEVLWKTLGDGPGDRAGLAHGGSIIYEAGDPEALELVKKEADAKPIALGIPRLASATGGSRTRTTSPTAGTRGTHRSLGTILSGYSAAARALGTLVHAAFEEIRFLDGEVDLAAIARTLSKRHPEFTRQTKEAVELFAEAIDHPELRELLEEKATRSRFAADDGDRVRIENELPVATVNDGVLLRGTVDRLALLERDGQVIAAEVIDWKTDRIDPEKGTAERVEHHRAQMESYRQAVSTIYNLAIEKVTTRLAMVRNGELLEV